MSSPQPSGNGEVRTLMDAEDTQGGLPLRPVRAAANNAKAIAAGDIRDDKPGDNSADGTTNPMGRYV